MGDRFHLALDLKGEGRLAADDVVARVLETLPLEHGLVDVGAMVEPFRCSSREVEIDGVPWRLPGRSLLVALLAGRVGSPEADPSVPAWAYLATGLKAWQETESVLEGALSMARALGIEERVSDGLAIVLHIFPELRRHVREESSGAHTWERRLTVPLAARRLVGTSIGEER